MTQAAVAHSTGRQAVPFTRASGRPTGRRLIRSFYVLWGAILAGLWISTAYLSSRLLIPDPLESRWLVVAQIDGVITVASFLPILLLLSFFNSERLRAQEAALTEAQHNGWKEQFQADIGEWYERVFDERRYPIPATLALLTFLAGWMFVFFHDGGAVDRLLASRSGMNGLVREIANGPAVSYGFLGSYFFSIWFLFKRYISGDLGPGAFLHVSVRTWLVAILVLVVAELMGQAAQVGVGQDAMPAVIAATAFVGALVPSALLKIIWDTAIGVGNRMRKQPDTELSLTVLSGMNAWKAARLVEEGIDNVQNLAMDQPSRLFVVTREGGLRILDWVDQAILVNAATPKVHRGLSELGIRTAYELFLALQTHDLVHLVSEPGETAAYRVDLPTEDQFPDVPLPPLRYVAVGILHHPNFENIRRMREQALRTAADRFAPKTLMPMTPMIEVVRQVPTVGAAAAFDTGQRAPSRGLLIVHAHGLGPAASGVLIGPDLAVTTVDVASGPTVSFERAIDHGDPNREPESESTLVRGELLVEDMDCRLALFRLARTLPDPVTVSLRPPAVGDLLTKHSPTSGVREGAVESSLAFVAIEDGPAKVTVKDALLVRIPSMTGDAGAPLFDASGALVAISVAGAADNTIAVAASRIPTPPAKAPGHRVPRPRMPVRSGNGRNSSAAT
jgi:hypothetical protein